MDPTSNRTLRDLSVAVRRSFPVIVVAAALGLVVGIVLRPSASYERHFDLTVRDQSAVASAMELPPGAVADIQPSQIKGRLASGVDQLVPDLPDGVSVSLVADDAARKLEIIAKGDSEQQATDAGQRVSDAIGEDVRARETARITELTDYHRGRVDEIHDALETTTADTDRALLLVERANHLDAIGALQVIGGTDVVESAQPSSDSAVVSDAGLPVIVAGAILGAVLGLLIVYVRLLGDRSVRRASDLEQLTGAPTLAVVPAADGAPAAAAYTALASSLVKHHPTGGTVLVTSAETSGAAAAVADAVRAALTGLANPGSIDVVAGPAVSAGAEGIQRSVAADSAIVVARSGSTKGEDLRSAVRVLETAGASVFGTVLTGVPAREVSWATDPQAAEAVR